MFRKEADFEAFERVMVEGAPAATSRQTTRCQRKTSCVPVAVPVRIWGNPGRVTALGDPAQGRIVEVDPDIYHRIWRSRGGSDTADDFVLLHCNCRRQVHAQE